MNKRISKKYKFNINTGHYEFLTEGEIQQQADNVQLSQEQAEQNTDNTTTNNILPNTDTPEVALLEATRDQKMKNIDIELQKMRDSITTLEKKLADAKSAFLKTAQSGGVADTKQIVTISKQIINIKVKMEMRTFDKAKIQKDDTIKILNIQNKLLESQYTFPDKYKALNESNIHKAKIYINTLVGDEHWQLLHGMVDVKKTFGNSCLLYGKDKKGYFAVCIDQEDFDRMYNALLDVGYTRDIIIDAIMPQIFDRGDFIKGEQ